jgi:hypothetical protein
MQETHRASGLVDTVIKLKIEREQDGETFEGNDLLRLISNVLREMPNDELFALYTDFKAPSVSHEVMEERDFSEYDNPISLMRFAIGLQIEDLVNTFFPEPETSVAYDKTISYIRQTLDDLVTYVQHRIESHVAPEREQEALLDLIEEMYTVRNNAEEVLG